MSNKWIISEYQFFEHHTFEHACTELARLEAKFPTKKFRIYRIKKRLQPSDAASKIKELQENIKQLEEKINEQPS